MRAIRVAGSIEMTRIRVGILEDDVKSEKSSKYVIYIIRYEKLVDYEENISYTTELTIIRKENSEINECSLLRQMCRNRLHF